MKYEVDKSWSGPYDLFPPCKFSRHVGCVYAERELASSAPCDSCGWNPEVSNERIEKKYGKQAVWYLSERKKRAGRNV